MTMSDDDLVELIGGEDSVDLVTVAVAVHWFDLPKFYSVVKRVLRKPGGIIAVWSYNAIVTDPEHDDLLKHFREASKPFWDPKTEYVWEGYRTLPFPFESVGLGSEGQPVPLEMPMEMSFEGVMRMFRSSSAFNKAKDQGVDLLSQEVIENLQRAWGDPNLVRKVTAKVFMLAGKV
ncbi:hypothetical protein ACFXTO_045439 [Malus domestica]